MFASRLVSLVSEVDVFLETRGLPYGLDGLLFLAIGVYLLLKLLNFDGPVTSLHVEAGEEETSNVLHGRTKLDPNNAVPHDTSKPGKIVCWDPATMDVLAHVSAMNKDEVFQTIESARKAQQIWKSSKFSTRRRFLKILNKFIMENAETIARVACRDSGKTMVDAMLGEVLTTCEKIKWTISEGEKILSPEYRSSGTLNMHKTSRVEYQPVGVVAAIVPWNYPFHNVFNPLISAVFAGDALIIKVSEYASWSTIYYGKVIQAALASVGAPKDLVQFVTGFGEAGNALVTGGVDKVIFVGSVGVGKMVMKACAETLTPVVLELGGKDAFIICEDANPRALAQLACRGVFQHMGQNCAGPERFLVYDGVYDVFVESVTNIVKQMRQGPPLASPHFDCGAVCMPQHKRHLQTLVDDAVAKGARVTTGGFTPEKGHPLSLGQFYPPTVLVDVTEDMLIMQEEIFGPIMCIVRVKNNSDAEAVRIANNCNFGLSGCCHSANKARASLICSQLAAGMASVNDLEGTTYLSQSLPFGGVKHSGFGRFAGAEGLRGMCHEKSIVEDRLFSLSIPAQIMYPSTGQGPKFTAGLVRLMYGSLAIRAKGLYDLIHASIFKPEFVLKDHELQGALKEKYWQLK